MAQILMPMATAVWLVDNTTLSFKQIADFCNLHEMEVQSIADGEFAASIIGRDPIAFGQLAREEIEACQKDPERELVALESNIAQRKSKKRYIPIAKRRDKPDAVAWIVKNHPEIPDSKVVKLIGTTKNTIEAIRSRTHANISAIQPKDPVLLGLCSQIELDNLIVTFNPEKS